MGGDGTSWGGEIGKKGEVVNLTNECPSWGRGGVKTNETWVIYGGNGLEKQGIIGKEIWEGCFR